MTSQGGNVDGINGSNGRCLRIYANTIEYVRVRKHLCEIKPVCLSDV